MLALGEGDPAAEPERRRRRTPADGDTEIAARNIDFQDAVLEVAGTFERRQHLLVTGRHVLCGHRQSRGQTEQGQCYSHVISPPHAWRAPGYSAPTPDGY